MSLYHVAFDDRRMTRASLVRYTQILLEGGEVVILAALYLGSIVCQVPDPACAASSVGGRMHVDGDTVQDA